MIAWPIFIVIYGCVFGLFVFLANRTGYLLDSSRKLPPLEPPGVPNILCIATLRGGANEMLRLFLFELVSSGLLELTKDEKGNVFKGSLLKRTEKSPDDLEGLSPQGKAFLDWFRTERVPKDVFRESPLKSYVSAESQPFFEWFGKERLLRTKSEMKLHRIVRTILMLAFFAFGIFGMIISKDSANLPAIIPILCMVLQCMVFWLMLTYSSGRRLSVRGREYLKAVQNGNFPKFNRLGLVSEKNTLAGNMFAVGLLGLAIVPNTGFSNFSQMFNAGPKLEVSFGGCGEGCSGGCGGGCDGGCGDGCSGCGGCGGCGD